MAERREATNDQAGGGGLAMANAAGGDFAMHRRLVLAVAMEIGDRGGGEDFTAAGGAGGAGGGGVGEATAMGEAAGGGEVGRGQYWAISSSIRTFNSWSCCSENPNAEAMVLRLRWLQTIE